MTDFLPKRIASNGLLLILPLFILLHFLILSGIISFEMVWSGKLESHAQIVSLELFSITMNLMMLGAVAVDAGIIRMKINSILLKIAFWTMFALFLLTTLGNLSSNNSLEKVLFTPVTLLLSLFSLRLALSKESRASY